MHFGFITLALIATGIAIMVDSKPLLWIGISFVIALVLSLQKRLTSLESEFKKLKQSIRNSSDASSKAAQNDEETAGHKESPNDSTKAITPNHRLQHKKIRLVTRSVRYPIIKLNLWIMQLKIQRQLMLQQLLEPQKFH